MRCRWATLFSYVQRRWSCLPSRPWSRKTSSCDRRGRPWRRSWSRRRSIRRQTRTTRSGCRWRRCRSRTRISRTVPPFFLRIIRDRIFRRNQTRLIAIAGCPLVKGFGQTLRFFFISSTRSLVLSKSSMSQTTAMGQFFALPGLSKIGSRYIFFAEYGQDISTEHSKQFFPAPSGFSDFLLGRQLEQNTSFNQKLIHIMSNTNHPMPWINHGLKMWRQKKHWQVEASLEPAAW